ncbi:FG-GAP-like repeat-containing protein [Candidatus Altiarchaeota archaeon]
MRIGVVLLLILLASGNAIASDEYMSEKWNYTTKEIISGLGVADLNGDGNMEVVVAASQMGAVYSLDLSGNEFWERPFSMGGYVFEISPTDLDLDGASEVMVGYGSDAVAVSSEGNRIWKFSTSMNHVQAIDEEDVNGDGKLDVIIAAYKKDACKNAVIYAIDPSGYPPETIWKEIKKNYDIPTYIDAADLDGDGKAEVIVGFLYRSKSSASASCHANMDLPSKVITYDQKGDELWEFSTPGGVSWVEAADLDGDGMKEVIVSARPYIYVLNQFGQVVWDYELNDAATAGTVADIDDDGKSEVILAAGDVVVLDFAGNLRWTGATGSRVYSISAADVNNNGYDEVIAGSNKAYIFDKEGKEMWAGPHMVSVDYVEGNDMDGDGYAEVVVGAVKTVHYYKTEEYAKRLRAKELYDRAVLYKQQQNYELALDAFNMSKELYRSLGDMSGVSSCINELQNMYDANSRVEELKGEASGLLDMSKEFYVNSDYMNATAYAMKARVKYSGPMINDRLAIDECDKIIANSKPILVANASDTLDRAYKLKAEGKLSDALEAARRAETLFAVTGDMQGMGNATGLSQELSEAIGPDAGKAGNATGQAGLRDRLGGMFSDRTRQVILATFIIGACIMMASFIAITVWKRLKTPRLKFNGGKRKRVVRKVRRTPAPERSEPAQARREPAPREKGVIKCAGRRTGHCIQERMDAHKLDKPRRTGGARMRPIKRRRI